MEILEDTKPGSEDMTVMATVSSGAVDLYDVRKTQRRLKVLINVNDVVSPQRHPIRRKPLPHGMCYVCSHLDVEGKYQHPHAYLFRKGFFHKCGHHPSKTPYPTLIESGAGDSPEDVFNFNKQLSDEELKFSVSVRVKSRRDTHSTSPIPIFGQTHFDTAVLDGVKLESRVGDESKFHLPSIFSGDGKSSGHDTLRTSRNSRKSSNSDAWRNNSRNSQNLKNNSRTSSRRQLDNYKINPTISDQSWLEADGYLRNDDIDNFEEEDEQNDEEVPRPKSYSGLDNEPEKTPSFRPQSENTVSPRTTRPKAGRRSIDSGNGDEGHIKYHHRSDNESMPNDGFSFVSRESSVQTPAARSRISSKLSEQELALFGSQISRKNSEEGARVLSQSSSSFILQKIAATGMADHWCTCHDIDYSTIKCEECLKVGGHEKWCVHAKSFQRQGNCPHCGKPIMKTSKRASGMSFRGGSVSTEKQSHSEEKRVKFEDDDRTHEIQMDHNKFFRGSSSDDRKDTEEDEEDDVWTKTEERFEPTIDTNIHKRAYLKALFELRMSKLNKINELDESWILDRISKPTFSYFKLRPGQEKANANSESQKNIGLTPDHSHLPSMKNSMKHIFGKNIKVDDYYPGGKKNPLIKVTVKKEKKRQTMPVHSIDRSG